MFGIRLRKKVCARSKSGVHLFKIASGGGVEDAEAWAQQDRLTRYITAAVHFALEIYVGEKRVDMELGPKVGKCLRYVAGRKDLMAPVPHHGFSHFSNEKIVFDDQNYCHFGMPSAVKTTFSLRRWRRVVAFCRYEGTPATRFGTNRFRTELNYFTGSSQSKPFCVPA